MKVKIDSFLKDLIPEYLEGRKADMVTLSESIANKDLQTIEKISHKMAGNLGSYGFKELGSVAKKIEEACMNRKPEEEIANLINNLREKFEQLEIEYT